MWKKNGIAAAFLCVAACLLAGINLHAQDVGINLRGPYRDMGRNLIWGQSGLGGFNADYILTPTNPTDYLWVFIRNNNPTSTHNFSFQAYEAADPRTTQYLPYSGNGIDRMPWLPVLVVSWPWINSGGTNVSPTSLNPTPSWIVNTNAVVPILLSFKNAARLALYFTGGTTQTGSPDTADIWTAVVPPSNSRLVFFDSRSVSANSTPVVAQSYAFTAGVPIWPLDTLKACTVVSWVQNTAGTTPTLNLYFQTTYANTGSEDLISFAQATTGTINQVATVNFETGAAAPKPTTDGALTVNTVNNGFGVGDQLRLKYVLAGTTPSYAISTIGFCH